MDEIVAYGRDRRAWLCFCSGVEHAVHMRDEIRSRGFTCETVTGETPTAERDRILSDFASGRLRAVTNNSVMTTGTNIPPIDLVAFCRPTQSAGLYVQMAGRGLRLSPGKDNCLFLDFAGVVRKHGPIDAVTPPSARSGSGEAPIKICPQDTGGCGSIVHASARHCPDCGFEFPVDDTPKITAKAEDVPMLSTDVTWRPVTKRVFRIHQKTGKEDSIRVVLFQGLSQFNDYLGPERAQGFFKTKSDRFWVRHGGQRPCPTTNMEFLERQSELSDTAEIQVRNKDGYWNVADYRVAANDSFASHTAPKSSGNVTSANDNVPAPANDNSAAVELDDAIPF